MLFQQADEYGKIVEIPLSQVARQAELTMETIQVRVRKMFRALESDDVILDITALVRDSANKARRERYARAHRASLGYEVRRSAKGRSKGSNAGRAKAERTLATIKQRRGET